MLFLQYYFHSVIFTILINKDNFEYYVLVSRAYEMDFKRNIWYILKRSVQFACEIKCDDIYGDFRCYFFYLFFWKTTLNF